MKTSRFICAALAAVMTVSTAACFTCSADFLSADGAETAAESAVIADAAQKSYKEADYEKFKEQFAKDLDENYSSEEYIKERLASIDITDNGIIFSRHKDCCEIMTYIGSGTDLVIPEKIDGLSVADFGGYYDDDDEELVYYMNGINNIKTLDIQAPLEYLPAVFTNCKALAKVTIPDSVTYAEKYVFVNTPWRDALEKKDPLLVIGHTLLKADVDRLEGRVVVPKGVYRVQDGAFYNGDKITEIVFPNTLVGVRENVFDHCDSLEKINFGTGVRYVDSYFIKERVPKLKKVILSPCITEKSMIAMINGDVDRCKPDKNFDNLDITYYYYKKTAADDLLSDKRYKEVKRSVLPGKTKSVKVIAKKKAATVKWKAVSTASGYQVQIATVKTFKSGRHTKNINGKNKTSCTFKNLKKGRKYYVRMRTYRSVSGRKYYGNYTKARTVTVK